MTPFFDGFLRAAAFVAVLLLLLALSACATPPQGSVIPPEVMAQCAEEGGCVMFTRKALDQVLQHAADKTCRGSI